LRIVFLYLENGELRATFTKDEFINLSSATLQRLGLRTPYLYSCQPDFSYQEETAPEVLRIEKLRKRFDGSAVLDGINFSVRRGETVALIGANGVCKITVGKILSDLLSEKTRETYGLTVKSKKTSRDRNCLVISHRI
jgi:ATPase subunit of ABC transporter with duplicated ATPase domains